MLPTHLRPLASLGVTVALLVLIAIAMIFGTTYESFVGTTLAQADIYHSVWFDLLLGLLAINLVACTLNSYPYKLYQIGWLLTHVGILVILAGAVISRNWSIDGQLSIAEGQSASFIEQNYHQLEVKFPDGLTASLPLQLEKLPQVASQQPDIIELPYGRGKIVLIRFLPVAMGHHELIPDPNGLPALHVKVDSPMASADQWLYSGNTQDNYLSVPMIGNIIVTATPSEQIDSAALRGDSTSYYLFVAPSAILLYSPGRVGFVPISIGQTISIGKISLTVLERKDKVNVVEKFESVTGNRGAPALQCEITDSKGVSTGPIWIGYGTLFHPGVTEGIFRLKPYQQDLGFSIHLVKFERQFYPGSDQAASYASDVNVIDSKGIAFPFHISMNHPLEHHGWKFYQSSFREGTPQYSIFAVSYDPGTGTVYAGSIILIIGLVGTFFLKQYLRKY